MDLAFFRLFIVLPPLLILPIVGIWLLKTGIWPRRRGETPYCAGCGYNLTGLTGERCPECGGNLAVGGIVYGERRRSPRRIVGGTACMLPLVMIASLMVANINWYRLAPAFLLISDLQSKNPNRAWDELDRRIRAGTLSASSRSRVIDLGLKEQVAATPSPIGYELMDQLGKWAAAGLMSEAQAKTFYDQIVTFAIRVRPKVVVGDNVPIEIGEKGAAPSNLTVRVDDGELLIDGKRVSAGGGGGSFSGRGAAGRSLRYQRCEQLGQHTAEARPRVSVHFGSAAGTPLHQRTFSLKAAFEIVAPSPEHSIRLKADPALTDKIRQAIRPDGFEFGRDRKDHLEARYKVEKVPENIAFEVFARIEGKEYRLSRLCERAGDSTTLSTGVNLKVPPFTKCDLIFRSSEKAARETLDLYEIWHGELVYKDVPVKLGPYAATQPATRRSDE